MAEFDKLCHAYKFLCDLNPGVAKYRRRKDKCYIIPLISAKILFFCVILIRVVLVDTQCCGAGVAWA